MDGTASVRGRYTSAPGEPANLLSPSLDEQARQFSTLLSGATPALPDDQRSPSPAESSSPEDRAGLQDPLLLKDVPVSRELAFARSLVDAKARHDSPSGRVTDPVDSLPRREVNVASFLAPSWPLLQVPVAQTPAAAAPDLTLAELVQWHVRRALATDGSGEDEVRLELSDAVFPGTTLSLRRAGAGWQLLATTDNRQSKEKLGRFAPALRERFAEASLGPLEIITHDPKDV